MSSRIVRGKYVRGCGHAVNRPKFYEKMGLHRGTINIQIEGEFREDVLVPTIRVPGCDPIDDDQDFLVRPCVLKDAGGYQILPITRSTGKLAGHHTEKQIEVGLVKKIDVRLGEELQVELQGYDD